MIVKKEKLFQEKKEKMQGGKGAPLLTHVVSQEILKNNGRLFAKIEMKPGESIGYHQHLGEQEIFYFLEGEATVKDNEKIVTVSSGDVMVTPDQGCHSIENTGTKDLVYMALILKL